MCLTITRYTGDCGLNFSTASKSMSANRRQNGESGGGSAKYYKTLIQSMQGPFLPW